MEGISESIGKAFFTTYSDMGVVLEDVGVETHQVSSFDKKVIKQHGAKSLFVQNQNSSVPISKGDIPKYPSSSDDSKFFDFGTIVMLSDIWFKGDEYPYHEHLPVFEDDEEYLELVKQSLHFMINHADASTLGWTLEFKEYNTFPMLRWLRDGGFEHLAVKDKNWKRIEEDKTQLVILR